MKCFKRQQDSMTVTSPNNKDKSEKHQTDLFIPLDDKRENKDAEAAAADDVSDSGAPKRSMWGSKFEFILSCIGYAVGIGNLWRFPYLCMRNGGGAFLIPYFLALFLCAMPLFFLELVIGQFSSKSPLQVWDICPLFKGLGYGMVMLSGIVTIYYNIIITWVLYYLFKSFTTRLPWADCGHWWNNPLCLVRSLTVPSSDNLTLSMNQSLVNDTSSSYFKQLAQLERVMAARAYANISDNETIPWKSPAEQFWQHGVLELSSGIEDTGGIKWELFGCLVLSWVIVFLCLFKGVQSSGKVVYVTATTPYIFLTLLLIRGLMLPGAIDGIKYFIIPDWQKLKQFKVWAEASLQIFYSLGPAWGGLITMASYNEFNNNCLRDGIIVPIVNSATSLYGGFVIFSVIGFMANEAGLKVQDVVTSGPGLAFIAYPEAITKLPISPMWAIFFFIMLLTLGLDTQFGMVETVTSGIIDQFPKYLRKRKIFVIMGFCIVEILLGIPLTTRAGMYIFQIMDWYVGSFTVMLISLFECFLISWVYGHERIYGDIEMMIGYRPSIWWKLCWAYISPSILMTITIYNIFAMGEPYYGTYLYPRWAIAMGWMIAMCTIVPIPVLFVKQILSLKGSFVERVKLGLQPSKTWGPHLPENRERYRQIPQHPDRFFLNPLLYVKTKHNSADNNANNTEDNIDEKQPFQTNQM